MPVQQPISVECHGCGRKFESEFVTLMGNTFIADRYCVLCREEEQRQIKEITKNEGSGRVEVVGVVKEVTRKNIEPRNGAAPFTLYEIEAGDHKWTTKKQDIALSAHSLVGKMALINGTVQKKGSYTNYFINSIQETDAPATSDEVFGEAPSNTDRDESIWRQTATKVAASLADTPTDFWQNVDTLINFYRTGEHPGNGGDNEEMETEVKDEYGEDIPF